VKDHVLCFILIIVLFDEGFKYGDGAKFLGYVGTNAEELSVEFCNFVLCHISVNHSIIALND
jgi:hypothetical protein